jgi:GNAT superfamily N-acetyltransferase
MQKCSFRRETASDAGTVYDITRSAYAKQVAAIGREPKPMTANDAQAVLDHVIDLLEENGRPIALIEIIPSPSQLLIENIAVLPDRYGEGVGGVLLEPAETIARSLGVNELRVNELRLYTDAKFSTNLSFYARHGFL